MSTSLTGTSAVTLPAASSTQLGGVMVQSDSGILVDSSGDISVDDTRFLSVATASATYASLSDIPTQNGVQFNNSVEVFSLTSNGQTITVPQNKYLILINGPFTYYPYGSAVDGYFTLELPTPAADGHTFEVAAGSASAVTTQVPSGSTSSIQLFGGTMTNISVLTGDSSPTYVAGTAYRMTFTYVESTDTWYGR